MKSFFVLVSAIALPVLATYNLFNLDYSPAEAYQFSEWEKYHCLTTDKLVAQLPSCVTGCQYEAAKADHLCRPDDYVCHCLYPELSGYARAIAPCAASACSPADLAIVNATVADMCNFFEATLYASYTGCPQVQLDYGIAGLITTFALQKKTTVIEGA